MVIQYTLRQAAAMTGASYSQAWHIYAYGRLPSPRRVGKMFVFGEDDIESLRSYLDNARKVKDDACRVSSCEKVVVKLGSFTTAGADLRRVN